jgi:hypothetical protein
MCTILQVRCQWRPSPSKTQQLLTSIINKRNITIFFYSTQSAFVWISEQTAIISLYNINWLVFITEMKCVYCAVRAESSYTISLTFTNSTFCPHCMCFVWISEQTAIVFLYNINWLVFITEMKCVYCAVRAESSYTTSLTFTNSTFCPHCMCFVWISEQTAIISLYSINWLVCINETVCVYCAVRPGYLYIIEYLC